MSDDGNSRFKVIEGGGKPIAGARKKRKGDAVMCLCRVCQADTGTASMIWIKAKISLMERAGRTEGGSDAYVCALCLSRGKITRAT